MVLCAAARGSTFRYPISCLSWYSALFLTFSFRYHARNAVGCSSEASQSCVLTRIMSLSGSFYVCRHQDPLLQASLLIVVEISSFGVLSGRLCFGTWNSCRIWWNSSLVASQA
jgi:hypothetical protein